MAIILQSADLAQMLKEIDTRLRRVEAAKSFNVPYVATDPTYPNNGDMWYNTTDSKLYIWINGVRKTVTLT